MAVWAMTLVITVCSPLVATAATFGVYTLLDEGNILTASKTFAVLLLFAALRFPINYAGRFVGSKYLFVYCRSSLPFGLFLLISNYRFSFQLQRPHRLCQPFIVLPTFFNEMFVI